MTRPLLTPAEKAFLQAVIKPYRKWAVGVKRFVTEGLYYIKLELNHPLRIFKVSLPIDYLSNTYQFKGLELCKTYDLKTLGL